MYINKFFKRSNSLIAILCGGLILCITFIPIVAGGGTGSIPEAESIDEQQIVAVMKPFDDIIQRKADEYQVSFEKMSEIIDCENDQRNPSLQSRVRYTQDQINRHSDWGVAGERENSWGLVQIHLSAHKNISREQATDPEFAIDFLAKHLSLGNGRWWTCYS